MQSWYHLPEFALIEYQIHHDSILPEVDRVKLILDKNPVAAWSASNWLSV